MSLAETRIQPGFYVCRTQEYRSPFLVSLLFRSTESIQMMQTYCRFCVNLLYYVQLTKRHLVFCAVASLFGSAWTKCTRSSVLPLEPQ